MWEKNNTYKEKSRVNDLIRYLSRVIRDVRDRSGGKIHILGTTLLILPPSAYFTQISKINIWVCVCISEL